MTARSGASAHALLKSDAAGFDIILHVHDEIIAEVAADKVDLELFARCMLDKPAWAAGLPGPTMSSLGDQFGLEPLITASLAIISDARIGSRTDKSTIAERLLTISGEDALTVPRKYIAAWTGKLPTRFAILTNELPAFGEGSGALVGRFVMLVFPNSFYGREDTSLTGKLMTELPGILNWSMAGYQQLRERGHFIQPKNALKKLEQIEMLSAPVKAFVQDRCKVGPGLKVGTDRLYQAWRTWSIANGGTLISKGWFSRNLLMAVPGVEIKRTGHAGEEDIYAGIALLADLNSEATGPQSTSS